MDKEENTAARGDAPAAGSEAVETFGLGAELGAEESALLAAMRGTGAGGAAEAAGEASATGTEDEDGGGEAGAGDGGGVAEADEAGAGAEAEEGDEAEAEEAEEAEEEAEVTPVQKRINKLTAQKKELAERLAAREAELREAKAKLLDAAAAPERSAGGDPLSDVMDVDTLAQRAAEAKARAAEAEQRIAWCRKHRHGGEVLKAKGSTETVHLDADEVAEMREAEEDALRAAREVLEKHVPARMQWLEVREKVDQTARAAYPGMYAEGTADAKYRTEFLAQIRGLREHPLADLFIGDALVGAKVRHGQLVAVPKVKPKPAAKAPAPKPALSAAASPAPSREPGSGPDTRALLERAVKSGSEADIEAAIAARFG